MKKDNFSKKFKFYRTRNKNSHIHLYIKTQPCLVDFGPKSNGGNAKYSLVGDDSLEYLLLLKAVFPLFPANLERHPLTSATLAITRLQTVLFRILTP
jgi:hypothetical protein